MCLAGKYPCSGEHFIAPTAVLLCLPPTTCITECTHPSTECAHRDKVGDTKEESREVVGGTSENYEIFIYCTVDSRKRSCKYDTAVRGSFFVCFFPKP